MRADGAGVEVLAADPDRRGGRGVPRQEHGRGHLAGIADEHGDVGLAAVL